MKVHLFTDGGMLSHHSVRGKKSPEALTSIGYVIRNGREGASKGDVLEEYGGMTGKMGTNNDAEYEAVAAGLRRCTELGATEVILFVDSQMVAYQLTGQYGCKHDHLRAHLRHVKSYAKRFKKFEVRWVRREQNQRADMLCNRAMDLHRVQNGQLTRVEMRKHKAKLRAAKKKETDSA